MATQEESRPNDLDAALTLARSGDIDGARGILGAGDAVSDAQLVDALVLLHKGIECFMSQRHTEGLGPLMAALPVVDACSNEDIKLLVHMLVSIGQGLTYLFDGDAQAAVQVLNISADTIERIAFFVPGIEIAALSCKALSLVALAKSHMNASEVAAAEEVLARVRVVHNTLLSKLDPNNKDHALAFAEVYGTRFELAFTFIAGVDIVGLDIGMLKQRLDAVDGDVKKLEGATEDMPDGPIRSLLTAYPLVFEALKQLYQSLEIVVCKRRSFAASEVRALARVDDQLFRARQLTELSGERGRGLLYQLDGLRRLQQNLLHLGKPASQDYGRYSGAVSLVALVVLIVVVNLTLRPTGYEAGVYFLGSLILSLIVGFGFGALRFQPLLKVFADSMGKGADTKS